MKKLSFIAVLLLFAGVVFAQKAEITFEKKIHDFGQINESDGKATYEFVFRNTGNSPLVVSRVRASCGCTTPTWTRQPIEPGKSGSITVAYNPAGRPGVFTKTITVSSNATDEQVTLLIKGDVIPVSSSPYNPYPVAMGDLKLKTKVVQMNNVDKGKSQIRVIEVKNEGRSSIKPVIENLHGHLTAKFEPETLAAGQTGTLIFTFNSAKCALWGPTVDDVFVVINNKRVYSADYQLKVFANVIEDFSKLTLDQRRKAPILEMNTRSINLGTVKPGSRKSVRFSLSNKGTNALEVRRIVNNNKELIIKPARLSVAGGKTGNLTVELNSKTLPAGDYKKTITLQTNDPDNSFIVLVLNWKVQK
ncbi:MAG: DUF1573 domain-containing protein [Paludibacteraceae bacterium]|nr:DUF1573 domain-containing protein [Paludibacteraceae bacterium]